MAYPQRTDLNKPPVYGDKVAAQRQQSVVPVQQGAPLQGGVPAPVAPGARMPPRIDDPSGRANEPVQAGLPVGPGPGPEAIGLNEAMLTRATLEALYQQFPSPILLEMLERNGIK